MMMTERDKECQQQGNGSSNVMEMSREEQAE